ncbi:MAG TPA: 30S ribosome-binding factor RbfA [Actinomycetes bacterium]|jgi:ribosome-binding factor A|nr:30S ribosome-binding factor RbfA [Actinomycetes bacterium]
MATPSYPRARRLAETVRRLVSEWVEAEQADGRLGFVTVTDVRMTGDLRHATVFWTVLGGEQEQAATGATLSEATVRARTYVAHRVRLRHAPTLEFQLDDVPGRGARIDRLLAELGTDDGGEAPEPAAGIAPNQEGSQR